MQEVCRLEGSMVGGGQREVRWVGRSEGFAGVLILVSGGGSSSAIAYGGMRMVKVGCVVEDGGGGRGAVRPGWRSRGMGVWLGVTSRGADRVRTDGGGDHWDSLGGLWRGLGRWCQPHARPACRISGSVVGGCDPRCAARRGSWRS